jgi:hypothetical protein
MESTFCKLVKRRKGFMLLARGKAKNWAFKQAARLA